MTERRRRLIALAAAQRAALSQDIESWRVPLELADHGLAALRLIKRHPAWVLGGVALIAAMRPQRTWIWLRRGWLTWQIVHQLRGR